MTGKVNMTGYLESAGKDGAERKTELNGSLSVRIERTGRFIGYV